MLPDSLKKFNRIVAILIQLQAKKVIKAQDLADKFEVSLRTIYRDIQTLEQAGVPIIGEAGVGYALVEGYRLPPVMFTLEEAMSLVTAEKLMQQFGDKSIGQHHESAMSKIKAVLRTQEKEKIQQVESRIAIHITRWRDAPLLSNSLEIILRSIAEKKQVVIRYRAVDETITDRTVEAVGIFFENNYWYVLGYCLLRKDYRQFRTDRIISVAITPTTFSKEHGNIADHRTEHDYGTPQKAVIVVDKYMAKFLVNDKKNYGFVSERETPEGVEMTFLTSFMKEGFPRWLLTFGDYVKILEPPILHENMLRILKQIEQRQK